MSLLLQALNFSVTTLIVFSVQQFMKLTFGRPKFNVLFHEHDAFQ